MNPIKEAFGFIKELYQKKFLISELTKRDFKERFIGSNLGIFWAFIDPLVMSLIMWFVFGSGLRGTHSAGDVPFITWLLPAMFAWQFFSETLGSGTGVIRSYSFLIKKVNFRLSILPIVKIISSLVLHLIFVGIVIGILLFYKIFPSWYWLQVFYYMGATCALLLGLTWFTSSVSIFTKDIENIVGIFIRFGFFLTPIIWNVKILPAKYVPILKLNPMFYIVEGYRDCFLNKIPFWEKLWDTLYFWGFTFGFLLLGMLVFKKLRPHFADVI